MERSEAAAMTADVVIMTVSAEEGWTPEDTRLLERVQSNKVRYIIANYPFYTTICQRFVFMVFFFVCVYVIYFRMWALAI